LTVSNRIVPKVFNFKAHPRHVQALIAGSIDVVNLANNHVLDYDVEGLLETLKTLDRAGIRHVGAGQNRTEAKKPVILERKGVRIAICGYTDNEPGWIASQRPGTNYITVGDVQTVKEDIEKLLSDVDILIVTIHWGPNMVEQPPSDFIQFAHDLIDMGVDIVHGHSAHIFQGVEWYKKGLILYDTGDFIDDYYVDPLLRNDRSFFFKVRVTKEGIHSLEMTPTIISNFQATLATGAEKEAILQRMQQLSKSLGIVRE
jgi:poly-gamma-glutamate synthesis protein (capsule biosynthesis protein)